MGLGHHLMTSAEQDYYDITFIPISFHEVIAKIVHNVSLMRIIITTLCTIMHYYLPYYFTYYFYLLCTIILFITVIHCHNS